MITSKKKLTITVDPQVYEGLHKVIGPRKISAFLNALARPYVVSNGLDEAYRQMANDQNRENEAKIWTDHLFVTEEKDETW